MRLFSPNSVADFGCGNGIYLKELKHIGVKEIIGFDGSETAIENAVTNKIILRYYLFFNS